MRLLRLLCALLVLATATVSCKPDDKEDPTQKIFLGKLSKVWTLTDATLGTTDRTADFTGAELEIFGTFDASSPEGPYGYEFTGTRPNPSPWKAAGSWAFPEQTESVATMIIRDVDNSGGSTADTIEVSYTLSSDGNTLTLTFTIPDGGGFPGSARVNEVEGTWSFEFDAN